MKYQEIKELENRIANLKVMEILFRGILKNKSVNINVYVGILASSHSIPIGNNAIMNVPQTLEYQKDHEFIINAIANRITELETQFKNETN